METLKLREFPQSATRVLREALSGQAYMLRTSAKVPRTVSNLLNAAAGVLILEEIKVGLVAGLKLGKGILLKKIEQEGSNVTWSAPLYLKAREYSAGLTIGVDKVEALLLLSQEGVDFYSQNLLQFDVDVNAVTFSNKNHKYLSDALTLLHENKCNVAFVLEKGVMYDISLAGLKIFPDDAKNKKEYGDNITPTQILSGAIAMPEALVPLAQELKVLMDDEPVGEAVGESQQLRVTQVGHEVEVESPEEEAFAKDAARVSAKMRAELRAEDAMAAET